MEQEILQRREGSIRLADAVSGFASSNTKSVSESLRHLEQQKLRNNVWLNFLGALSFYTAGEWVATALPTGP